MFRDKFRSSRRPNWRSSKRRSTVDSYQQMEDRRLLAGDLVPLLDINARQPFGEPVQLGQYLFYYDQRSPTNSWSQAYTHLVATDLDTGETTSLVNYSRDEYGFMSPLTLHDDKIFFIGHAGTSSIWYVDETLESPTRVSGLNVDNEEMHLHVGPDGQFYFAMDDSYFDIGRELFMSDGTPNSFLAALSDLAPGLDSSSPENFFNAADGVFFTTTVGLAFTDGTFFGTIPLFDQAGDIPIVDGESFQKVGNNLLFVAESQTHGSELWISDGTVEGTELLKEIRGGVEGSDPSGFTPFGTSFLFTADDGVSGRELWITDGTEAGTQMLHDLASGSASSNPESIVVLDGEAYFFANPGSGQRHVFSSLGTAGSQLDLTSLAGETESGSFLLVAGDRVLTDHQSTTIREVSRNGLTNIHTAATPLVDDPFVLQGRLNFQVGDQLFSLEGSVATAIDTIVEGTKAIPVGDPSLGAYTVNCLSCTHGGSYLYLSDGTVDGTSSINHSVVSTAMIAYMRTVGDRVFFAADNGYSGRELWVTDGTADGTSRGTGHVGPETLFDGWFHEFSEVLTYQDLVIFQGKSLEQNNQNGVWRSDGTAEGTFELLPWNPSPYYMVGAEFDGEFYFSVVDGIWKTDGSDGGTELFMNLDGTLADIKVLNGELYFTTNDGGVYRSDGTTEGTRRIYDDWTYPSESTSHERDILHEVNGKILFWDFVLRSYDPDTDVVDLVGSINGYGYSARNETPFDGLLFVNDQGGTLWQTDGTAAGTVAVQDQQGDSIYTFEIEATSDAIFVHRLDNPEGLVWRRIGSGPFEPLQNNSDGELSIVFDSFKAVEDQLFFQATDDSGLYLWRANSELDDLQKVRRIGESSVIGQGYVNPTIEDISQIASTGEALIYSGKTKTYGAEIYSLHFPTTLSLDGFSVSENLNSCVLVGTLSTSDLDSSSHTYSLAAGEGDDHNGLFEIVNNSLMSSSPLDYEAMDSLSVRIRVADPDGFSFEQSFTIEVENVPELVGGNPVLAGGEAQRSNIDSVELLVDDIVDVQPGAFQLTARETGIEVPVSFSTQQNNGRTSIQITFSGELTRGSGSLIDGYYTLLVDGSKISNGASTLDFDGDATNSDQLTFGDDEADGFFAFFGDSDGNGNVNILDLLKFRSTYGLSDVDTGFDSIFDYTANGIVNIGDLLEFRNRYGTSIAFA